MVPNRDYTGNADPSRYLSPENLAFKLWAHFDEKVIGEEEYRRDEVEDRWDQSELNDCLEVATPEVCDECPHELGINVFARCIVKYSHQITSSSLSAILSLLVDPADFEHLDVDVLVGELLLLNFFILLVFVVVSFFHWFPAHRFVY